MEIFTINNKHNYKQSHLRQSDLTAAKQRAEKPNNFFFHVNTLFFL